MPGPHPVDSTSPVGGHVFRNKKKTEAVIAGGGAPQNTQPTPMSQQDAAALKQGIQKLKTSVPGLDVTKATTAMTKADTGTQMNPADLKTAGAFAPELADIMKNPQMAGQLKLMIDKANQQEKAAAAKPPGSF